MSGVAAGYLRRGKIAATAPVKLDQQAHRTAKGSGRRPPTTFNPDLYRRVARELGRPHGYRISTLPRRAARAASGPGAPARPVGAGPRAVCRTAGNPT